MELAASTTRRQPALSTYPQPLELIESASLSRSGAAKDIAVFAPVGAVRLGHSWCLYAFGLCTACLRSVAGVALPADDSR
jgi:hypothetical protein